MSDDPEMVKEFQALLQEAIDAFPQFDYNADLPPDAECLVEADVCGGDLVEWFSMWRERVRTALGITERLTPEEDQ
jgi:hypothetical protein